MQYRIDRITKSERLNLIINFDKVTEEKTQECNSYLPQILGNQNINTNSQ